MAYGDTPYDEMLKQAWDQFCDSLREAGELVFSDGAPSTPLDRAVGFRHVSRNISRALESTLEHTDPRFPNFRWNMTPTRKYGGDNPDSLYLKATIDGEHTYRIVGNRGSVKFIAVSVLRPETETQRLDAKFEGSAEIGRLLGDRIQTEWDGTFEIILSPDEHPGNWIKTAPEVGQVTIRQFFGDWERERPMTVRIERVGAEGEMPPVQTPEGVAQGLRDAGGFLVNIVDYWMDWLDQYEGVENTYVPRISGFKLGGTPGGESRQCRWRIQPDEVLLIEVVPPRAFWWNFELNNYWMNSVDYRYHLSSLNSEQAVLEEDGSLRIGVAHVDPGIANWLDTGGHIVGRVGNRWVQTEEAPIPSTRLVKLADLDSLLPPNARRITPEQRREQLRRRKIGVDRRFRV